MNENFKKQNNTSERFFAGSETQDAEIAEAENEPRRSDFLPSSIRRTPSGDSGQKRRRSSLPERDTRSFLEIEHAMQMKVFESQLEHYMLWKKEHEVRMQIMKKQLGLLNSDDPKISCLACKPSD